MPDYAIKSRRVLQLHEYFADKREDHLTSVYQRGQLQSPTAHLRKLICLSRLAGQHKVLCASWLVRVTGDFDWTVVRCGLAINEPLGIERSCAA
jgi:hypothetical protein